MLRDNIADNSDQNTDQIPYFVRRVSVVDDNQDTRSFDFLNRDIENQDQSIRQSLEFSRKHQALEFTSYCLPIFFLGLSTFAHNIPIDQDISVTRASYENFPISVCTSLFSSGLGVFLGCYLRDNIDKSINQPRSRYILSNQKISNILLPLLCSLTSGLVSGLSTNTSSNRDAVIRGNAIAIVPGAMISSFQAVYDYYYRIDDENIRTRNSPLNSTSISNYEHHTSQVLTNIYQDQILSPLNHKVEEQESSEKSSVEGIEKLTSNKKFSFEDDDLDPDKKLFDHEKLEEDNFKNPENIDQIILKQKELIKQCCDQIVQLTRKKQRIKENLDINTSLYDQYSYQLDQLKRELEIEERNLDKKTDHQKTVDDESKLVIDANDLKDSIDKTENIIIKTYKIMEKQDEAIKQIQRKIVNITDTIETLQRLIEEYELNTVKKSDDQKLSDTPSEQVSFPEANMGRSHETSKIEISAKPISKTFGNLYNKND